MKSRVDIAVIGAGAAGYFAAIQAANQGRNSVVIFEKTAKVLSKVAISGGGRCNVTHNLDHAAQLVKFYPRGGKKLLKGFEKFGTLHTRQWFEDRGVLLKTEADGRVFPVSDNSQTIIDCLLAEADKMGVTLKSKTEVVSVHPKESGYSLELKSGERVDAEKVIITTGGGHKAEHSRWLSEMGIATAPPIPSLFTFNVPNSPFKDLMGLSVANGFVQIPGTKWKESGPILITHWGFSGPGVIKLSSVAAVDLHAKNYRFPVLINWTGRGEEQVLEHLEETKREHKNWQVMSHPLFEIPSRLWNALCELSGISPEITYANLPTKSRNRLVEALVRTPVQVEGKTTFKEEFVTCGGVQLSEIDLITFESRKFKGMYFAGEILNVDGLTGGFNFQHAWTSAFLAGSHAGIKE